MDKETLSNYGWIVILVLILAVMIALATPFGNFIAGAIRSTTAGFFSVNENALGAAGITIPGQEFTDTKTDDAQTNGPVKFKQPYSYSEPYGFENLEMEICFVFYEEGKATMFWNGAHNATDIYPVFNVTYYDDKVVMEPIYNSEYSWGTTELYVSEDGTELYFAPDDTTSCFSMGSKYSIPIDIDTSLTTDIPTVTFDENRENGISTWHYQISKCDSFKGTIAVEFFNYSPSEDTDTSKYTWTANSLFIDSGELTDDYGFKLVQDFEDEWMGSTLVFVSSGFYILEMCS